ncbi:ABC-type tungstate transport system, permease component [Schinkia azotoformans MEV2011]|uniref:ABC-type tungstate transport system, permease component n=1 Tax=Schinkia azotoformans MEV2011 TaxID=1348973 RepID=A0A072NG89_SCHAZ|nr:substrate-binding domain-containing protein [Schinkia azotoformans]KEF36551.1 ABC-type tungstate transport system, permease component [Schinkia azotoformans MEV2011]MEC1696973.1 substrate-binding domain-containing protein [Schinkia azotoformans]MEC1725821.1 substrate-binding domain-containing protein [Schinkia azotoformans]MEC1778295.1 substrate-binding domain-containing protein [Schinkia azotoformans]MED4329649.1 substrate-binding domain-containing protein [Schinkia azotoformans]
MKNSLIHINKLFLLVVMAAILVVFSGCSGNQEKPATEQAGEQQATENTNIKKDFVLATTTSTQDSGLLDVLVPMFEEQTGFMVKTIAVGTGKALEMGQNGEADVLLVHAPESEQPLVDSGVVTNYQLVMHNDFIVVGPKEDPAGIKGLTSTVEAFKKIAENNALFVSRGDDSGTHKKELGLWKNAEIEPSGKWYQETGQGMGATLKVASEKDGYSLTDRATYLALKHELNLDIILEGEESLLNIYHVMQVNPEKFENINGDAAKAFVDFMVAPETQKVIGEFGVEEFGEPLFFPDANTK